MNRTKYFVLDYYNKAVINKIISKYGIEQNEAVKLFITSKTHEMLEDSENGLFELNDNAIFDMWECEQLTGEPRKSVYIRGE